MPDAPPVIRAACSTHRTACTVRQDWRAMRWVLDAYLVQHANCGKALTCFAI